MDRAATPQAQTPAGDAKTGTYRWFVLFILFVVYIFNFLDRQVFSILQESIKADLQLSDTQVGFLGGFAFAILYSTLGIPIARLADRHNRSKIIAIALTFWSALTIVCGMATNFLSLAAARIGVGIGEAGGSPPAHSLISDYFKAHERATALALYSLGIPLGSALGYLLGGLINEYLGWREAFFYVGAPGVVFAVVVYFFLKDPRSELVRRAVAAGQAAQAPPAPVPFKDAMRQFWRCRAYMHLCMASALTAFVGYGSLSWLPAFMIRTHGVGTAELSLYLAVIAGIGGAISTVLGGLIADRLAKRDKRWLCWFPAIVAMVAKPMFMLMLFQGSFHAAMLVYIVPAFLGGVHLGPIFGTAQSLVPASTRALAAAFLLFLTNLIGMGLGPLFVGILSDVLNNAGAENSLRWAMVIISGFAAISILHYFLAARTLRNDLAQQTEA